MKGGEPSASMVFHIADKWHVSAEWLALGRGKMNGIDVNLSADQKELIENFEACDAIARSLLLTMIKAARISRK